MHLCGDNGFVGELGYLHHLHLVTHFNFLWRSHPALKRADFRHLLVQLI